MGKLQKKDLNKIKYVSAADFYKGIDKYDSLDDKLRYATRYILSHDMSMAHDYSLSGIVSIARMKLAELASNNPQDKTNERIKALLADPEMVIKGEANKVIKEIDSSGMTTKDQEKLRENCKRIVESMNGEFNAEVAEVDKVSKSIGVRSRVETSFDGRKGLEDNLKATKSNWFRSLFSGHSKQWNELQEAYQDFHNPHNENFGDYNHLSNASIHYIQHKFPNWNPQQPLPENALSKLNKTEQAKYKFATSVFDAVQQQYKVDDKFHQLLETSKLKEYNFEELEKQEPNVIDLDQVNFQNKLKNDVELGEDLFDISIEDEKDLDLTKDNNLEVPENEPQINQ